MFAVIKTGGKQYRVSADDVLKIEKLDGAAGDQVVFDSVLMVGGDDGATIGTPFVQGASVAGEILDQQRSRTVIVFKKRRRKNSRRRNGHRQMLTSVRITDILTDGKKPAAKKAAPKKTPAKADESKEKATAPKKAEAKSADKPAEDTETKASKSTKATEIVDDVALIGGVGPKLKETLGEAGITSLKQIAELDDAAAEKLDTDLNLRGRIARDEWIEQAKELLAGKPPRAKADREAAEAEKEDK